MFGLTSRCRVRYVYAAHVCVVDLLLPDRSQSKDWLCVRLPILPPLAPRTITVDDCPPFLPKQYVDPNWESDSPIEQLGPCPRARKSVLTLLAECADDLAVHLSQTYGWLDLLFPGAIVEGDLLLDGQSLSQILIRRKIAKPI